MKKKLPHKKLGFFPTPIHKLNFLTNYLEGPEIFIKRDDQTGLAFGGNKVRKLEYLIGDALEKGCDTVITGGAEQSNHCRQTAAAAASCGLNCHLVLGGEEPAATGGNLLLDKILGANIHWTGESRKGEKIPEIVEELKSSGLKPYDIPYGGSNIIGALGFVNAMWEMKSQVKEMNMDFTHIVFASSSGGTHAGMIVGNYMFDCDCKLIGIGIDKEDLPRGTIKETVEILACETAKHIGFDKNTYKDGVIIRDEYLGEGYGVVGEAERDAIKLLGEKEGILLDPVYSGRAMAGLIDMIKKGEFNKTDKILFWHTGGTPSLFSYASEIL